MEALECEREDTIARERRAGDEGRAVAPEREMTALDAQPDGAVGFRTAQPDCAVAAGARRPRPRAGRLGRDKSPTPATGRGRAAADRPCGFFGGRNFPSAAVPGVPRLSPTLSLCYAIRGY